MDTNPFVSIIVPVYNSEKLIGKCIESLLAQDYSKDKYEVIVVDNGSKDGTRKVIEGFEVRGERFEGRFNTSRFKPRTSNLKYIYEAARGSYKARNSGVKQTKGEILAFIDADCVADENWLKKGVEEFSESNVGCVAGEIKAYEPSNYVEEYLSEREILSQQEKTDDMPWPYAKTANAFYRKDIFNKVGLFEERWISGGDANLSWRMQLETDYKIKFSGDAVVFHRHRSTLRAMFKQCLTWGIGYALLTKKYRDKWPKRTFKQNTWTLLRLFFMPLRLLPFYFQDKEKIAKEKRSRYLDYIAFAGWELGKVIGLKYRA